jgi:hypothetical protein
VKMKSRFPIVLTARIQLNTTREAALRWERR